MSYAGPTHRSHHRQDMEALALRLNAENEAKGSPVRWEAAEDHMTEWRWTVKPTKLPVLPSEKSQP